MLKNLLKKIPGVKRLPGDLSYEEARDVLERNDLAARNELAGREDARPEMLYHLASDESPKVRRKVAANPSTPIQAGTILVSDEDDEVRCELARKIGRLLPDLQGEAQEKICETAIAILDRLASDQLPRVREIVAEEIKHSTDVPKSIALKLARDVEAAVRAPVLQYSPLLSDDDLLEILASGIVDGAITPIARRAAVSEPVADAVVASLDISAIAALLANKNAQIREETLDSIIAQAEDIHDWHQPIVMRPELSLRAVRRVAGFVASALLNTLLERDDLKLDDRTTSLLKRRIQDKIKEEKDLTPELDADNATSNARALFDDGKLDEATVSAAASAHRREFVTEAIALLAGIPELAAKRVLESRSGKAITALSWKAGLSMRSALTIQREIGQVPSNDICLARNGVDFPMDEEEMNWHLQFFNIST